MIYNGINATKSITDAYDQGVTREQMRQQDTARKNAGGMIAGGNLTGAAAELFGIGDLQGGMDLRSTNKTEGEERETRRIMTERSRRSAGPAGVAAPGSPAPANNRASSVLAGLDYGAGAVKSEALPEMGAAPAATSASEQLGANLPADSKTAFDMRRLTGGDISAKSLFSTASDLWASGDTVMAKEMYLEAIARQGIETDLDFKNEGAVAQHFVEEYGLMDRGQRTAFATEVRNNKQMLASAPKDVLEALLDGNPENDDEAMRRWARSYGVDPAPVDADADYEKAEARRRAEETWGSAEELRVYGRKAAIDASYEEGGKNYKGPSSGGGDQFIHPSLQGKSASYINAVGNDERDELTRITAQRTKSEAMAAKALEFETYLDNNELWDRLTSPDVGGALNRNVNPLDGKHVRNLNSITNALIPMMREPNSGTFTDKDAEIAETIVLNLGMGTQRIKDVIQTAKNMADRTKQYERFMRRASQVTGAISTYEAQTAWDEYANDVPMFIEATGAMQAAGYGKKGTIIPNIDMRSYEEWLDDLRADKEDKAAGDGEILDELDE